MEKAAPRGKLWVSGVVSPGPGTYDVGPEIQRPKKWTHKLRKVRPLPVMQLKRNMQVGGSRGLNDMLE
jgi:hypothetical protein